MLPILDGSSESWIGWTESTPAVVLDPFTMSVWQQLDGASTTGELAAELVEAGFPTHLDPLALVATAVDRLVAAGMAVTSSVAPPPLPPEHRRTMPGSSAGGSRSIHRRAFEPDVTDDAPDDLVRPPGALLDLGAGWVATRAHHESVEPPAGRGDHRWCARRYISPDGRLLVPSTPDPIGSQDVAKPDRWHAESITALSVARVGEDRAEVLADLASSCRTHDRLSALRVLVDLIDRVDAGPDPSGGRRPAAVVLEGLRASQPWIGGLLDLGRAGSLARSLKIRRGGFNADRWIVWITPHQGLTPDQCSHALEAAGLPPGHAQPIAGAISAGSRFVVGTDGAGTGAGRKLYVDQPTPASWAELSSWIGTTTITAPPAHEVATAPEDTAGPGPSAGGPVPVFVAWKWWPDRPRVATYWRAAHHNLDLVLPAHPDWARAIAAFPIHRSPGHHLLLVESGGRRSLDLVLPDTVWGAELEPQLRQLAAVAEIDGDLLVETVGTNRIARVIGGLDDLGEPLAGLYFEVRDLGPDHPEEGSIDPTATSP